MNQRSCPARAVAVAIVTLAVVCATAAARADTTVAQVPDLLQPSYAPDIPPAETPKPRRQGLTAVQAPPPRIVPPESEFYVVPEFGMELGVLSRGVYAGPTATQHNAGYTAGIASLAFGGRVGVFNLGMRYQGSYSGQPALNDLQFHKLYGDLGYNWRRQFFVASLFVDFGYAALVSQVTVMHGLGGKAGAGIDLYPLRWLSIGPVVSFDVQGFSTGQFNVWVSSLGASVFARIGFHI
jgi:hypothetical protein